MLRIAASRAANAQAICTDIAYELFGRLVGEGKVTLDFMSELQKQIDMNYLLSLPYPAPFEEQKYLLDEQLFKKEADGTIRSTTLEEQSKYTGYKGVV